MDKCRIQELTESWDSDERWNGITRPYTAEDVIKLRGSIDIEHTLSEKRSRKALEFIFMKRIMCVHLVL